MLGNNPINIFLINQNVILHYVFSLNTYGYCYQNIYNKRKNFTHPFHPDFLMLLAEKSLEMFPKHKGYLFLFQNILL